jgi:uncharacterized protein YecE (DUF72 family)
VAEPTGASGQPSAGRALIGTSGFSYRDWRRLVYPDGLPAGRWLTYYATVFDTVELNATFYRLPTAAAVDRWAAAVPPDFTFAVKLGQFGSHRMKLRDAASWLPNHVERFEPLGTRLGPTLVQLPPRWHRDAGRLDELLAVAPASWRWAVEMRDRSWLDDEVFDVLSRHGAALVLHDLLADHPLVLTTDWTYLRFHGPDALSEPYVGRYTGRKLWRLAELARQWLAEGIDVYGYFNNDHGAAAVLDARWFRSRLSTPPARGRDRARPALLSRNRGRRPPQAFCPSTSGPSSSAGRTARSSVSGASSDGSFHPSLPGA